MFECFSLCDIFNIRNSNEESKYSLILSACSSFKIAEVDPATGYFPGESQAPVILNKAMDLDQRNSLILVPTSDFSENQIKNINYFKEVITIEDLEKIIITNDLGDQIPSVRERIGLSQAAKKYKPFLWLRYVIKGSGNSRYAQFILTDPLTSEDYFITETHLDYAFTGVNDYNNWYPMYNSLIDYIKDNSKTYK